MGAAKNENISAPQKDKWYWKSGIGMYCIQEMMREPHYEDSDGRTTILPAIIQPKNPSARNCIVPPCQSCLLARARKPSPKVSRTQLLEDREGAITRDQYKIGDFVSTDQFICKTPGRLPTGYGHESQDRRFQGGTIYNDAASGLIWVENQVSLGANETVWERLVLNNGCGINVSPKSNIIMVITEFSLPRNIAMIVTRKDKVNLSLGLALNTKMHVLREPFKQSCTWHGSLWSMPPCIGQIIDWMIFLSSLLR